MEYVITWGGEVEDVSVRTYGEASLAGLNDFMYEGLGDNRWRPGLRILLDHRELDWTRVTPAELRERVRLVSSESERLGNPYIAMVVGREVDYGLQRMMQAYSDDWSGVFTFEAFYTVEEARAWLGQFPPSDAT